MRVTDTNPSAQAVQFRIQSAMSGEQRMLMAFEMSLFARELAMQGIRQQHPDWPESRVLREFIRLTLVPDAAPMR